MKKTESLKSFFYSSVILVVVLGLIICLVFKVFIFNPIYQSNLQEAENTAISLRSNIEEVFKSNAQSTALVAYSTLVQNYLAAEEQSTQYYLTRELDEFLEVISKQDRSLVCIAAVTDTGKDRILYTDDTASYAVIQRITKQTEPGIQILENADGGFPQYYCYSKRVIGTGVDNLSGEYIGMIHILYSCKKIENMMNKLMFNEKNFLSVVDEDSRIVMSTIPEKIGEKFELSTDYKYLDINDTNLKLVNSRIINTFINDLEYLLKSAILIFVVLLILILGIYMLLNYKIILPIRKLSEQVQSIGYNELSNSVKVEGGAEIKMIVDAVNRMLLCLKNMTRQIMMNQQNLYEMEILKQQSMLEALLSQINPHFLYNCFECINGIASEYHCPEIITISSALSKIFRYSVKGDTMVLLRQEFEIVEEYIKVMEIRFPGRFTVSYDVSPDIFDKKALKMFLQPVVENFFKHGLANTEDKGVLKISGKLYNGVFAFTVEDNGVGIEPERLKALQIQLCEEEPETKGVGLFNINRRIKICYGKEYGVQIDNHSAGGTVVKITFPGR